MKYSISNGIHIVEVPINDFKIVMCNTRKKSAAKTNYANCGFFAGFKENKESFTLPVGHTVCDFESTSKNVKFYCNERGKFVNNKYYFDSSKFTYMNHLAGKAVSTLIISNNKASIEDIVSIPNNVDYAISGVPIMRDGNDVKFATYVRGQGWDASTLYGTWHIFVGLQKDRKYIYVIGMKTKTGNMITSAEAYKAFKSLGLHDVIKLDGGGSFHMNVNGKAVATTAENRLINTIITFDSVEEESIIKPNPYPVPTRTLKKGSTGDDVKWLQWHLNALGYSCMIDGKFGNGTHQLVLSCQKSYGLKQDGIVGAGTRKVLIASL